MVNDYEDRHNPSRDPLEIRVAIETLQRLRQILSAQRCIVCTSLITPESPAVLTIFDLAICGQPECAAVILDVPVGELIDDDGEEGQP